MNDVATAAITWHPTALTEHGSLGSHPSLPLLPPSFLRRRAPRHIKPQASGTTSPGPLMLAYHRQIQYRVSHLSVLPYRQAMISLGGGRPDRTHAQPPVLRRTDFLARHYCYFVLVCGYSTTWRNCFSFFSFCFWFPSHFGR